MSVLAPFNPSYTLGQTVTAGAASASVPMLSDPKQIAVTNTGSNIAYVRTGNGALSASVADFPIMPGARAVLTKGQGADTFSYISALGTTLHVIPGEGW